MLLGAAGEIAEQERRCVAESLSRRIAECRPLIIDFGIVKFLFHIKDFLLRVLQHGIQSANDGHRQDDIAVFAAHIYIPQAIVCDSPYKIYNLIVKLIIHCGYASFLA